VKVFALGLAGHSARALDKGLFPGDDLLRVETLASAYSPSSSSLKLAVSSIMAREKVRIFLKNLQWLR
jgi:hypothetical protein